MPSEFDTTLQNLTRIVSTNEDPQFKQCACKKKLRNVNVKIAKMGKSETLFSSKIQPHHLCTLMIRIRKIFTNF